MKKLLIVAAVLGLGLVEADSASTKGQNNSVPPLNATPSVHHTGVPSSLPHYSGSTGRITPYRPVIAISNGNRTFIYPPVRSTAFHQSVPNNFGSPRFTRPRPPSNNIAFQQHGGPTSLKNGNSAASNVLGRGKLQPQISSQLRNWRGQRDGLAQAQSKHWDNCHHHHDHDWWRRHCLSIVLFDFGWWGWDAGWWYPAWGYDAYYSNYDYNQPIYDYGGLSPEEIVANVQQALQQQGYYDYAVDGVMGPQTQAAIGRYQRDHRLPITYGVDPATLGALGLIAR